MPRLKTILIALAAVVGVIVVTAGVLYRLHFSDPSRTLYCRLLPCPRIDHFDALCGLLAEAEFQSFDSPESHLAWLRAEVDAAHPDARALLADVRRPAPTQRYDTLIAIVRASGGQAWSCPAAQRTLPRLP